MLRSFLLISVLVSASTGHHLVLVQTLFRHGDRTPTSTYPNDPYQESAWPASWGQLTTKGMLQHFEQGIKIRDRYIYENPFITGEYHDFDVYVRSTDVNRTLMSAYAHIAGFYENSKHTFPSGNGLWPTRWSPVPVHTVEIHADHLLIASPPHCPRMHEIHKTLKSKPAFVSFMKMQEPLLRTISEKTGIKTSKFDTFAHVEKFYSGTKVEKENKMKLPAWITDSLWEQYVNGKYRTDDYLHGNADFGQPENTEMIALRGGSLLKTMIDNMDLVLAGKSKKKFFMYSAHDTTVAALLRTLQAKQEVLGYHSPDYAATVILELWMTDGGAPFIRARYIANTGASVEHITKHVKGCGGGDDCPFADFKSRSQPFLATHIHQMCGNKK